MYTQTNIFINFNFLQLMLLTYMTFVCLMMFIWSDRLTLMLLYCTQST